MRYSDEIGKFVFDERIKGRTYKDIAGELHVVPSTVYVWFNNYVKTIDQDNNDSVDVEDDHNDNDVELLSNEEFSIYPLGDVHIGNPTCNYDLLDYWSELFENDNNKKVIIGLGDPVEVATKNVGNSSFKQDMDVNEQLNLFTEYLKPFKNDLAFMVRSNHPARIRKDFDLDIEQVLADNLGCKLYNHHNLLLNINDQDFSIYAKHGKGSVSKEELAFSKLIRDNVNIESNIILNGHTHLLTCNSKVVEKGNYNYFRRYYGYCGSFLNYKDSYGDEQGYTSRLPGFLRFRVDNELRMKYDLYYADEIL